MGRQSRVGGPPPQGPVPVLAGLMDGNGCSIGTHILSYKPGIPIPTGFLFAEPAEEGAQGGPQRRNG